jgi:hypothetical protein
MREALYQRVFSGFNFASVRKDGKKWQISAKNFSPGIFLLRIDGNAERIIGKGFPKGCFTA